MTTAYLFPGQGSQFVGMGLQAVERSAAAKRLFAQADEQLGYALSDLCFNGPLTQLTDTTYQTPANFVLGMVRWVTVVASDSWPQPDYIVGQSMGAISALAAAGAVSFSDGLTLAVERGALQAESGRQRPGAMAAVLGLSAEITQSVCADVSAETNQILQLANDNSPVHQNISGEVAAVELALPRLKAAGARKLVRLPISIASHCDLMATMAEQFADAVACVEFQDASVPLVSNVSAELIQSADDLRREIVDHLTRPVRWRESMLTLRSLGTDTFVDIGPGDSLSKLMKRIDRTATRKAFENE